MAMPVSARVPLPISADAPPVDGAVPAVGFMSRMALGLVQSNVHPLTERRTSEAPARKLCLNGTLVPFARGNLIYGESDPAEYFYMIVGGAARAFKITADGRRQIVAFYFPGDLFGFEPGKEHTLSAEAITCLKVRMIKRIAIMALAARDPNVANQLWDALACEQYREQEHILRLGKTARERVAGFLLELSRRDPSTGRDGMPMSRQDIADYLDLTIETVSRTLTQLKGMSAIAISANRRITIRDANILQKITEHEE
jgi:CRP/FNR family transcriptional regulator, nitrogen fixation regulation protein